MYVEDSYWIVREAVVECCRLPLVPVIVSVRVPRVALLEGCTVSVEFPEPVIEDRLKLVLTRDPCPLTLKLTVPANPFTLAMVTVYEPEVPRVTVSDDGDAEIVKSGLGAAFTTRVTDVV